MKRWLSIVWLVLVVSCAACAPTESSPAVDGGDSEQPQDVGRDIPANDADDSGSADVAVDSTDGGTDGTVDSTEPDVIVEDVPYARNARIGFQYVGSEGASHFIDDVSIRDALDAVLVDEGFEGGELPEGWLRQIQSAFYTWEVYFGPSEAHGGSYSAKVTWYENQDEWLITPPLQGEGPFELTFWNKGAIELTDSATLHVHYTCTDGFEWHELYAFPGVGEDGSYVWYSNTLQFDCP